MSNINTERHKLTGRIMTPFMQILLVMFPMLQSANYVAATFYKPSFDSDWLLMIAEDATYSFRSVRHNLGEVPQLVDVTVKALGGPNEDFIFKGIGDASRDDDHNTAYGGVVYIYDATTVNLYLPKGNNHGTTNGKGIYTGLSPHWTGVNTQQDRVVKVRVRCWTAAVLPPPCFTKTSIPILAGSFNRSLTFLEETTDTGHLPELVKVRAKMQDNFVGWYTDAQGSAQANQDVMGEFYLTGGLISAFDRHRIRVWTSSNSPFGKLFGVDDGWGATGTHVSQARSGLVDMYAWCSMGIVKYKKKFKIGDRKEQLEQSLSVPVPGWAQDGFVSVTAKVLDGVNKGLYFEGISGATNLAYNFGRPCSYGGLVFGYSDTLLRVWRPNIDQGAIVCVPEKFGTGIGSQAARWVEVKMFIWTIQTLDYAPEPVRVSGCGYFWLHADGMEYFSSGSTSSTGIMVHGNVAGIRECSQMCTRHGRCNTFSYSTDYICTLVESATGMVAVSVTSQIWTRVDLNLTVSATTPPQTIIQNITEVTPLG